MAFEIARVHGLISSRVGDEGGFKALQKEGLAAGDNQAYSQSCRPLGAQPHPHDLADLSYYFRGYDQRGDGNSWPLESLSSCSTETESDEEGDLFQGLAKQVAHSMLGEEKTSDHVGILRDNGYSEGQLSPSSWSSGSWSSRSQLTGSRSSSKGSSRVSSQVSSPSSAPSSGYQDAWETLYAAAGEVVRLKMNEGKKNSRSSPSNLLDSGLRNRVPQLTRQSGQMGGRTLLSYTHRKDENPMAINQAERNWAMKYEATIVPDNQGQSCRTQCYQYEQAYHADAQRGVNNYTRPGKMVDSKTMQRTRRPVMNGGSSMRVVFLGANTRRESGTGVFLPRVFVQKKPSSSRQNENSPTATVHGRVSNAHRHAEIPREGVWPTLQKSMNRSSLRQPAVHEPCLPIEWTY